jgi:uncharacterized protein (TIGR03083 family)
MTAAARHEKMPPGLRDRVLAAALRARAAGRPQPPAPPVSPAEAFGRAADACHGMLRVLPAEDWHRPALRGLDVQGLVGHLTGVEEDLQRSLAGDPRAAEAGHIESTQAAADRQSGLAPSQTLAEWRRATGRTLAQVRRAGDLGREYALHGMQLPLGVLLVVRAFELWVHENDVRQAVGLTSSVPDPSTLSLMTQTATGLLPYAAAANDLAATSVHLVLTGPGGGTWDIRLGLRPPAAEVTIVTSAVGFCRLVANRETPGQADPHVTGDRDRAALVLATASSLALD